MKFYPDIPRTKIDELPDKDPEAYRFMMVIVHHFASRIYKADAAMRSCGLEKCAELIIGLIDKGLIKPVVTGEDDDEQIHMGKFNHDTGEYDINPEES